MATALLLIVCVAATLHASASRAETQGASLRAAPIESAAASYPAVFEYGVASWYQTGERTANGERFKPDSFTAAHPKLPFGTRVKVVEPRKGRSVVVRINDRGPFVRNRVLDLSRAAARALGLTGIAVVTIHGLE
jgi:rare lipoprotein A